jgi:hypothetical protein
MYGKRIIPKPKPKIPHAKSIPLFYSRSLPIVWDFENFHFPRNFAVHPGFNYPTLVRCGGKSELDYACYMFNMFCIIRIEEAKIQFQALSVVLREVAKS